MPLARKLLDSRTAAGPLWKARGIHRRWMTPNERHCQFKKKYLKPVQWPPGSSRRPLADQLNSNTSQDEVRPCCHGLLGPGDVDGRRTCKQPSCVERSSEKWEKLSVPIEPALQNLMSCRSNMSSTSCSRITPSIISPVTGISARTSTTWSTSSNRSAIRTRTQTGPCGMKLCRSVPLPTRMRSLWPTRITTLPGRRMKSFGRTTPPTTAFQA